MNSDNQTLAGMGAEIGYQQDDDMQSVRVTGFLALILGLLSVTAFMGTPLLVFSVFGILFGAIALRRHQGAVPVGTSAAKIGMVLAIGFGAFGIALPRLKLMTLGSQAEQFSLDYLNLIARGDYMLANELKNRSSNRLPPTMSLADHYATRPEGNDILTLFHELPLHVEIRRVGPNADWQLHRPIRVRHRYGHEEADVVWFGPTGEPQVQFFLEYHVDPDGVGQWHVRTCQGYREKVVAAKVL